MNPSDLCTGASQFVAGGLRGYRTWNVNVDSGKLHSRAVGYEWGFDGEVAQCLRATFNPFTAPDLGDHPSPDARCKCGLYAWYHPDDTRIIPGDVFGAIEASGRVLLGAHGFRAERARLRGVVLRRAPRQLVEALHDRNIPIFRDRAELLAWLPPDDVSNLVDHTCDEACQSSVSTSMSAALSAAMAAMARLDRVRQAITQRRAS